MKEGIKKLNCWEFKNCGYGPDGKRIHELDICPAAKDDSHNGKNGGSNSGRYCWKIKGTFCKNKKKDDLFKKFVFCIHCDFFQQVQREEGLVFKI